MTSKLIGNELYIGMTIILSPHERFVFEKLNEDVMNGKRINNPVSLLSLSKYLYTRPDFVKTLINNLRNMIGFAYEIKETKRGTYTYYQLKKRKDIV